jgi:hypothetical protein
MSDIQRYSPEPFATDHMELDPEGDWVLWRDVAAAIDPERLADAMRECDGVNWPKAWRETEHNFDWVARQVAAAYRRMSERLPR